VDGDHGFRGPRPLRHRPRHLIHTSVATECQFQSLQGPQIPKGDQPDSGPNGDITSAGTNGLSIVQITQRPVHSAMIKEFVSPAVKASRAAWLLWNHA